MTSCWRKWSSQAIYIDFYGLDLASPTVVHVNTIDFNINFYRLEDWFDDLLCEQEWFESLCDEVVEYFFFFAIVSVVYNYDVEWREKQIKHLKYKICAYDI